MPQDSKMEQFLVCREPFRNAKIGVGEVGGDSPAVGISSPRAAMAATKDIRCWAEVHIHAVEVQSPLLIVITGFRFDGVTRKGTKAFEFSLPGTAKKDCTIIAMREPSFLLPTIE